MAQLLSRTLKRMADELDAVKATVETHKKPQTKVDLIENVVYVPSRCSLYDQYGVRIDSSLLWRDRHFPAPYWPPAAIEKIDVPENLEFYDDPVIYLGVLIPHWGHFCTESIARIWAAKYFSDSELKFVWAKSHPHLPADSYVYELFDALSINSDRIIFFDGPVLFRRAIVPHASCLHDGEYFANHADIFKIAARNILGKELPQLSSQPVYLSRSKFRIDNDMAGNNRTYSNERALEEILERHGVRIIYTERLNLTEKIILFNSHSRFIGPCASSFFALFFSLRAHEQEVHAFFEGGVHAFERDVHDNKLRAFLGAYSLIGVRSYYIATAFQYVGDIMNHPPDGVGPDYQLDIPQALGWLSNSGLIDSTEFAIAGAIKACIRGTRGTIDLDNESGLSAGRRYSGRALEAICVDTHSTALIEYRIENGAEDADDWVAGGKWAGLRGYPIDGIAFKIINSDIFSLKYVCTFVGLEEPIWIEGDEICRSPTGSSLETVQLFITRRRVNSCLSGP